jgi:GNAT superfamily N-acetyltransferase/chloramphenicol 3-O-phosphotransferase
MTFTIRPATSQDQEIILELWAHLIAYYKSIEQVHPRRTTEPLPSLIDQTWADPDHERIFIAEEGPRTTGFVRVTVAANGSCDGRIETIYVDARHRRNGVGRALIEAASRWLRKRGAGDMCVDVIASDQAAEAFCKHVGFRRLMVTHMASLASENVPLETRLPDVIVVAGAPGTGKTTVCQVLAERLASPYLDLGRLRSMHLDRLWQRMSAADEAVAFENLLAMVRNYCRHDFRPVLVSDLTEDRLDIVRVLVGLDVCIVTLVLDDPALHKRRVLDETRDSGYRDWQAALAWNQRALQRDLFPNEHRLNSTRLSVDETVDQVLSHVSQMRATQD